MRIKTKNKFGIFFSGLFGSIFFLYLPCPCFADGDFEVTLTTSRTTGVAPLSIFFDVTSTPTISDGSYVDTTCVWNFDTSDVDTNGRYRTGSGFVAAHVFENPGTYTVRVDIYTPSGQHAWETETITVSAFSGTTYYVATDGSDSNDGLSTTSPFQTVTHALTGPHVQANTSILFKKGDTFYVSDLVSINDRTGPIIISGYSDPSDPSSAKPIIYSTASDSAWATINIFNSSDLRIMNLAVRAGGPFSTNPRYPSGITFGTTSTHILKYRTEEYENGDMAMSPAGRYNTVAECSFHDTTNGGYASSRYGFNTDNAIIGNSVYNKNLIDQYNEEHVFRLQGGSRYYIAHNTFGPDVRVNNDILTIRGDTDKVVIYDNTIYDYLTDIQPQNKNSAEEYQHHCVIDSNLFIGGAHNGIAIGLRSKDIVVRNNIIYNYHIGVGIENDSVVGPSQRIKIYNNTMINPHNNSGLYNLVFIDAGCFNIELYNNLLLDVGGTKPIYTQLLDLRDSSTFNGTSNHNVLYGVGWNASSGLFDGQTLSAWQSTTGNDLNTTITDPYLVNININSADDLSFCHPDRNSHLIGNGLFTGAALDYHGNIRDSSRDIGAVEFAGNLGTPKSPFKLRLAP